MLFLPPQGWLFPFLLTGGVGWAWKWSKLIQTLNIGTLWALATLIRGGLVNMFTHFRPLQHLTKEYPHDHHNILFIQEKRNKLCVNFTFLLVFHALSKFKVIKVNTWLSLPSRCNSNLLQPPHSPFSANSTASISAHHRMLLMSQPSACPALSYEF